MFDILEDFFTSHIDDLTSYLPDGLTLVDLTVLKNMDLLEETALDERSHHLPQCMYAIETNDKITLYNDYFAAWIIPMSANQEEKKEAETILLIARLSQKEPSLEIGFTFKGIYNQSKTILRVLDKAIADISETEKELNHIVST